MSQKTLPISCFAPLWVKNPYFRKREKLGMRFLDEWDYTDPDTGLNRHFRDLRKIEQYYLEVPCGKCYLCRKRKANSWRVRLFEEIKDVDMFVHEGEYVYNCIFVCFTFDEQHIPDGDHRAIIAPYIRKWRDLWRKKYGCSPRYYAVTDKGSQFGRIHLHLLIFSPYDKKRDRKIPIDELRLANFYWRNGMAREPSYLRDARGITYVTGYITGSNLGKDAKKHGKPICYDAMVYNPIVFVSNGLGAGFFRNNSMRQYQQPENPIYYLNGFNYGLPKYYKDKLVDKEFRFHSFCVWKREKEQLLQTPGTKYSLSGTEYTSADVVRLYNNVYKQYDKTPKFTLIKNE